MYGRPCPLPAGLLAMALALMVATGCAASGSAEPGGNREISVTVGPTSASVQQAGSVVVTVTVTTGGSFSGTATISVEGAPTGVTGTVGPLHTTGATSTADVAVDVGPSVTPGTYTLTIRASGPGVGSTATFALTVTAGTQPVSELLHEDWAGGINTSRWTDGYSPTKHSVVSDPTGSGRGQVLRVEHIDDNGAGWLAHWIHGSGQANPTGEVFLRTWIYIPTAFDGSHYAKVLIIKGNRTDNLYSSFGQAGHPANGTNFFDAYVGLAGPSLSLGGLHFYTYHVDMPGVYGEYGSTRAAPPQDRQPSTGAWHRLEFWLKQNTVGQKDGEQRVWLDGNLVLEWTGLRFRTDAILQANCVAITFSEPNNKGQIWYVDDIYVYDRLPSGMAAW